MYEYMKYKMSVSRAKDSGIDQDQTFKKNYNFLQVATLH